MKRLIILLILAATAGVCTYLFVISATEDEGQGAAGTALAMIVVPAELTPAARNGRRIFDANCAICHGTNAVGQDGVAPPLIHEIYRPGHHGDESFQRAVAMGVRAHHWRFGNMARVEGLDRQQVALIVEYIRELQRANGID